MASEDSKTSIEVEEFLEQQSQKQKSKEKPLTDKDKKENPDLEIKIDKWGFAFMMIFIAIIGYLVIAALVGIVPFSYNSLTDEYEINDLVVTILGIAALIFLGLGIYFVWIKKQSEEDLLETDDETPSEASPESSSEQITFVYKNEEDDKK